MTPEDLDKIQQRAADLELACASTRATYPSGFHVDGSGIRDDEHRYVGSLSQRNLMFWFVMAWGALPEMATQVSDLVDEVRELRALLAEAQKWMEYMPAKVDCGDIDARIDAALADPAPSPAPSNAPKRTP